MCLCNNPWLIYLTIFELFWLRDELAVWLIIRFVVLIIQI